MNQMHAFNICAARIVVGSIAQCESVPAEAITRRQLSVALFTDAVLDLGPARSRPDAHLTAIRPCPDTEAK